MTTWEIMSSCFSHLFHHDCTIEVLHRPSPRFHLSAKTGYRGMARWSKTLLRATGREEDKSIQVKLIAGVWLTSMMRKLLSKYIYHEVYIRYRPPYQWYSKKNLPMSQLENACHKSSMKINGAKCKIICSSEHQMIIDGEKVEHEKVFIYIGNVVSNSAEETRV